MKKLLFLTLVLFSSAFAEERSISISGRNSITITTPIVKLGDLAEVSSKESSDDDAVIGLQKLFISTSPQPGKETTISAAEILMKLKEQGVNLQKVIYTLPRVIKIQRAGRELLPDELLSVVARFIAGNKKDAAVKKIFFDQPVIVDPSVTEFKVIGESRKEGTKNYFSISTNDSNTANFEIAAQLEEFREIPIAKKPIAKGAIINQEDIGRARFNVSMLPKDISENEQSIIGLAANTDIGSGEVFRATKLAMPIAIHSGEKVIMQYRTGLLDMTATGVSAGDGVVGQEIKIKNDSSKKMISGIVIEPGLVRVK